MKSIKEVMKQLLKGSEEDWTPGIEDCIMEYALGVVTRIRNNPDVYMEVADEQSELWVNDEAFNELEEKIMNYE